MRTIHKGLILVTLPLIFEFGFIWHVRNLMIDAFDKTDRISKSQDVLEHVANLEEAIQMTSLDVARYSMKVGTEENLQSLLDASWRPGDTRKQFKQLRKLFANDARDVNDLLEFEGVFGEFESLIQKLKTSVDTRASLSESDKIIVYLNIREKLTELKRFTKTFIVRQKKLGKQMLEEHRQLRQTLMYSVAVGAFVNLIIAFVSVAYFSKSIGRRVKTVVDNSILFAAGKPLMAPLTGNDEIAEMDVSFRQMVRVVEESRQKEQAILANAVDIVCTMNDTGRITQANPALLNALDMDEDDILSRHLLDCIAPDDRQKYNEFLEMASQRRDESHRIELRLNSRDGSIRDFLWHVKFNEQYKTYYCVASDITQRKALERMKQEFIAMVSHDLRSPLTAILATFDLLSGGVLGNLTEKGANRIEMANLSLKRLINLINEMLDLDKLESGTIDVDLNSVSANHILVLAAESLRGMAEQNDISLEVRNCDLQVVADEDRLMQVLTNFVSNAIKFSPAKGVVTLSCKDIDGFVEFRVDDNGRGIPPDKLGLVFERFKQVSADDHKVKGGSGLGLAISKAIVEAHGGTIGVDSTLGVGSSFWFRIPNDKP